jgi:hypothetical protein
MTVLNHTMVTCTMKILTVFSDYLVDTILVNRQFIIFLSTLVVTLPLSLYRDIAKLSKVCN